MANINLLPWREWERERKQKEFLASDRCSVLLVAIARCVLGAGYYLDATIESIKKAATIFIDRKIKAAR